MSSPPPPKGRQYTHTQLAADWLSDFKENKDNQKMQPTHRQSICKGEREGEMRAFLDPNSAQQVSCLAIVRDDDKKMLNYL